jgi:riboflavin synthase
MFTGIVECTGQINSLQQQGGDVRLLVSTPAGFTDDVALGDSISVSGVCLTAVEINDHGFAADVSRETLACTSLGDRQAGEVVNLEKALLPTTRLGGHLVSGHVDGVGEVLSISEDARSQRWRFRLPAELARFVAAKGSITVDGVSLTINDVTADDFGVNLVPHTIERTAFAQTGEGARVNLEVDLLARYVARLLDPAAKPAGEESPK